MIHARGLVQTFHTRQGKQKTEVRAVDGAPVSYTHLTLPTKA